MDESRGSIEAVAAAISGVFGTVRAPTDRSEMVLVDDNGIAVIRKAQVFIGYCKAERRELMLATTQAFVILWVCGVGSDREAVAASIVTVHQIANSRVTSIKSLPKAFFVVALVSGSRPMKDVQRTDKMWANCQLQKQCPQMPLPPFLVPAPSLGH